MTAKISSESPRLRPILYLGSVLMGVSIACIGNLSGDKLASDCANVSEGAAQSISSAATQHFEKTVSGLLAQFRSGAKEGRVAVDKKLRDAIKTWMGSDPKGCLRFLNEKRCIGLLDEGLMEELVALVDQNEPLRALLCANQIENLTARDLWQRLAFRSTGRINPRAAYNALPSMAAPQRLELARWLAKEWGEKDGEAAVKAFVSSTQKSRFECVEIALLAWGKSNEIAALKYTFDLNTGEDVFSRNIREDFLREHPNVASAAAAMLQERLKSNPQEKMAIEGLELIVPYWVQENPEAAFKWSEGNTNDYQKNKILQSIGLGLAVSDPDRALQLADGHPSQATRRRIYAEVATQMAEKDAQKAFDFAASVESPILKSEAMRWVIDFSMLYHKQDAMRLLGSQENMAQWAMPLANALERRIQIGSKSGFDWGLNSAELKQVRDAMATNLPVEQRARLDQAVSRYEAVKTDPKAERSRDGL